VKGGTRGIRPDKADGGTGIIQVFFPHGWRRVRVRHQGERTHGHPGAGGRAGRASELGFGWRATKYTGQTSRLCTPTNCPRTKLGHVMMSAVLADQQGQGSPRGTFRRRCFQFTQWGKALRGGASGRETWPSPPEFAGPRAPGRSTHRAGKIEVGSGVVGGRGRKPASPTRGINEKALHPRRKDYVGKDA